MVSLPTRTRHAMGDYNVETFLWFLNTQDSRNQQRLLFCVYCSPQRREIGSLGVRTLQLRHAWDPRHFPIFVEAALETASQLKTSDSRGKITTVFLKKDCKPFLVDFQEVAAYFNPTSALRYTSELAETFYLTVVFITDTTVRIPSSNLTCFKEPWARWCSTACPPTSGCSVQDDKLGASF